MFRSQVQLKLMREQKESEMSGYFYNLVENTQFALEDIRDMFLEEFPNEEYFLEELVSELSN